MHWLCSLVVVMAMEVHADAEPMTSLMHGPQIQAIDAQTSNPILIFKCWECQQCHHCFILLKKRTGSLTHSCYQPFIGFVVNQDNNNKKKTPAFFGMTHFTTNMINEVSPVYHESRSQQQAVQSLSHIGSMDVAVVGVAVFAVSSLQCRQELSQARDGDLQSVLHNHHRATVHNVWVNTKSYNSLS